MKGNGASKNKKWIQGANIKKGALSKKMGIPEKKDIPVAKLKKLAKSETASATTKRQANLAITLKKMAKKKKK